MTELNSASSILLIEADLDRAKLIMEVLGSSAIGCHSIALANGIEALDFLLRQGNYENGARPDPILLELNLPDKDGRKLLAEISANPELPRIPIVVLMTAASEVDILNTYGLQGNGHVFKSDDLDRLTAIVRRIEEFWLGIVTLPVS
jgi:two-component system, chemotaxis family, response regulator Rcp1